MIPTVAKMYAVNINDSRPLNQIEQFYFLLFIHIVNKNPYESKYSNVANHKFN